MNLDDFDPDDSNGPEGHLFGMMQGPAEARVVVIPVPFEATTTYGHGTSRAPRRILEASTQVDPRDDWVGELWREGIAMLPIPTHLEALNERASALVRGGPDDPYPAEIIADVDAAGAEVNAWVERQTEAIFDAGQLPGLVGGDHSVSFGAIAAAARRVPGLGLLHVDAHADLREAFDGFTWSHASILYNVRTRLDVSTVVSVGIRDYSPVEARRYAELDSLHPVTDRRIAEWTLAGRPFVDLVDAILAPLPRDVWITFDVDGLDPSLCPHTGTPVPGGLTYGQVSVLLDRLAASRRVVGFDLTEVGDGEWDANVGARLLYKLAGCAIATNRHSGNL